MKHHRLVCVVFAYLPAYSCARIDFADICSSMSDGLKKPITCPFRISYKKYNGSPSSLDSITRSPVSPLNKRPQHEHSQTWIYTGEEDRLNRFIHGCHFLAA